LRVAFKNRVVLPGERVRRRPPKPAFPEICWEKNRIWIWDAEAVRPKTVDRRGSDGVSLM